MDTLTRNARKITWVLFAAQSLSSAGIIAGATIHAIVGAQLSHKPDWAGVPVAVYQLGSAFSAFGWGYLMDRIGRRGGLTLGLLLGIVGATLAYFAIIQISFLLFVIGLVFIGFANAAMQLSRFAAAEVNPPMIRGAAISNVVLGSTIGAVTGPFLVEPFGRIVSAWGVDELAGAYLATVIMFALTALLIYIGLRPDPRELGKQVAARYPDTIRVGAARSIREILSVPAAQVAVIVMALGQMVMVLVMVITSLHMRGHNHVYHDISLVISAHTFGMFATAIISGRLADAWGRGPVILVGASTLALACLAATISPDVLPLSVALFLLGFGWNFCFVGGSTLLADQLSPVERSKTQGINDLMVGLASALGSLGSGFVFATFGYNTMALISGGVALIPLVVTAVWMVKSKREKEN